LGNACICAHAHTHAHAMNARVLKHKHTNTHAYAHTHTHIHLSLQAMERIHAITAEGEVLTDIAVFRRLYQAVGLGWVSLCSEL